MSGGASCSPKGPPEECQPGVSVRPPKAYVHLRSPRELHFASLTIDACAGEDEDEDEDEDEVDVEGEDEYASEEEELKAYILQLLQMWRENLESMIPEELVPVMKKIISTLQHKTVAVPLVSGFREDAQIMMALKKTGLVVYEGSSSSDKNNDQGGNCDCTAAGQGKSDKSCRTAAKSKSKQGWQDRGSCHCSYLVLL